MSYKEKDNDFKWLFTRENSLLNFSVHIFKEFYNFTLFVALTAQMHFNRLGPYTNHKGISVDARWHFLLATGAVPWQLL